MKKDSLILEKRYKILQGIIEKLNGHQISKKFKITYSHVACMLNIFEKEKLIERTRKGRVFETKLTELGEKTWDGLTAINCLVS